MLSSNEIRQQFIDFFKDKGHTFVPSSSVVPYDDPTLLFTNAGMNQFKDVFLGAGTRAYSRVANSQKCIRAGGKHNDLDDVGHDTYHHTFFEMLGNWSFGDYFKKEAIEWAWELLTVRWGLDKSRLHATAFAGDETEGLGRDEETAELWRSVTDIDPQHIHYSGKKDNFWEMANTGPCGPCSEVHMDLTPDKSGAPLVNAGKPQVIEIWNLVFIQFNRDAAGKLTPLAAKHVDTGMGLERITAILQGKTSNYDSDIFTPILKAIQDVTNAPAYQGLVAGQSTQHSTRLGSSQAALSTQHLTDVAYRVIADHIRCLTFALADGAMFSNEGRGYVLRRILRRAVRYGRQHLDVGEPFLFKLVPAVVEVMGSAFCELKRDPRRVTDLIEDEEHSFGRTFERGVKLFEEAAGHAQTHGRGKISGEAAFKLHDTYGFSFDLTMLMADERGLKVDVREYERLMNEAREKARTASSVAEKLFDRMDLEVLGEAESCDDSPKYDESLQCQALIRACSYQGSSPAEVGSRVTFITDRTCFYAEQGGQVSDRGVVWTDTGRIEVTQVAKRGDHILHGGRVIEGEILGAGQTCRMQVAPERRAIMKNHTATHMLNWALRDVLGRHVEQKGSLVDAEKTRFDFLHPQPVTPEELSAVEAKANEWIRKDCEVHTAEVPEKQARKLKTLRAVFGEKYPERVRVVSIGRSYEEMIADPDSPQWMNYSVEFCAGTHLKRTGQAVQFRIIEETGVAKGVRRITAVTGERAQECDRTAQALQAEFERLERLEDRKLAEALPDFLRRVSGEAYPHLARLELQGKLDRSQQRLKAFARQQARADASLVRRAAEQLLAEAAVEGEVKLIVGEVPGAAPEQIREAIDFLRHRAGSAGVVLGAVSGEKVLLFASLTDDLVARGLHAGELIRQIAPLVGGGGGGKPQLAQAGGNDPAALAEALAQAREWLVKRLRS